MNAEFELAPIINDDHTMDAYIKGSAFEALTQIVHNSLDASATRIDISVNYNLLGTIATICVLDDGCGIKAPDKNNEWDPFLRRGYSEKKIGQTNKFNRNLHGKNGDGRFKSYALGAVVEWKSKTTETTTIIVGKEEKPQAFHIRNGDILDEIKTPTGTLFTAYANDRDIDLSDIELLKENLERHFLTVLDADPKINNSVSIYLNGEKLSIREHIDASSTEKLRAPYDDVSVKTIIWKQNSADNNRLFWCDHSYNILKEERLDNTIQKTNNSLYIASKRIEQAKNDKILEFSKDNKEFSEIEKQAREIRENFLIYQKKLKTSDIIRSLKEQNLYPYNEQNLSSSDKISQPLYDNIIIKINEKKPAVLRNATTRKIIAATVKILIEQEPEHFVKILQNLLELTSEETIEFSKLLDETPLPAMIKTTRIVSDRIKFLNGLRNIVYGDLSKTIKERSQLHKILENEAWIFGEEFFLSHSDQAFNTIINDIRMQVPDLVVEEEFDGGHRIPDLFFTKKQYYGQDPWALIVELKRPKVNIGKKETQQIKDYYDIIKERPEFKNWKMDLVIISSDINDNILKGDIANIKTGEMYYSNQDPLKKLYIKQWGDFLDKNDFMLDMLKKSLELNFNQNTGKDYINNKF